MSRSIRFVPKGSVVEVTCSTLQNRLLLRPSPRLREIILGILGYAQERCGVTLHAFVFLSNHYHLLLTVDSAQQLAAFMNLLNSKLAREAGRLHSWRQKFWGRRYTALLLTVEDDIQIRRLRYILSHGVKEGFVASPREWPGVHCADALTSGQSLQGTWFDRTLEYRARRQGHDPKPYDYAYPQTVDLTPIPCWAHLPEALFRQSVAELLRGIEEEWAALRKASGRGPAGLDAVLRRHPHSQPLHSKKSPAPAFHAATEPARLALRDAYRIFLAAYRSASERLRAGDRTAVFPEGSFPPRLPFVAPTG
jgi:REP element-mobilizing transposase RayT